MPVLLGSHAVPQQDAARPGYSEVHASREEHFCHEPPFVLKFRPSILLIANLSRKIILLISIVTRFIFR